MVENLKTRRTKRLRKKQMTFKNTDNIDVNLNLFLANYVMYYTLFCHIIISLVKIRYIKINETHVKRLSAVTKFIRSN